MPKVLVVDDNPDMVETLEHLFAFYGFEVVRAFNGKEGIEVAEKEQPDIIILDALMPIMNGFEACEYLKKNPQTQDIPIIFLSANYTDDEHRITGLELGADDYVLKPFNAKELIAKINTILKRKEVVQKLKTDNQKLLEKHQNVTREIEQVKERIKERQVDNLIDPLTGLYDGTYFTLRLKEEFHRAERYETPLGLVLLDVDFFQKINEVYGEQTGDYILMKIANVILHNTRASDIVFRLKGNTFAILLPNTDETGAFYEAERIRTPIEQTEFFDESFVELKKLSRRRKQEYQKVTVSLGVAAYADTMKKPDDLYLNAQKALEAAKAQRRNVTIRWSKIQDLERGTENV